MYLLTVLVQSFKHVRTVQYQIIHVRFYADLLQQSFVLAAICLGNNGSVWGGGVKAKQGTRRLSKRGPLVLTVPGPLYFHFNP